MEYISLIILVNFANKNLTKTLLGYKFRYPISAN